MRKQIGTMSPVGSTAAEASARRAARDTAHRQRWEANAAARDIAWQIVKYRMENNLTQQELAARVGTSHSHISRIESGRHQTSVATLQRIGEALGLRLAVTLEPKSEPTPSADRLIGAWSGAREG